jgi:hypothetical protein
VAPDEAERMRQRGGEPVGSGRQLSTCYGSGQEPDERIFPSPNRLEDAVDMEHELLGSMAVRLGLLRGPNPSSVSFISYRP